MEVVSDSEELVTDQDRYVVHDYIRDPPYHMIQIIAVLCLKLRYRRPLECEISKGAKKANQKETDEELPLECCQPVLLDPRENHVYQDDQSENDIYNSEEVVLHQLFMTEIVDFALYIVLLAYQ